MLPGIKERNLPFEQQSRLNPEDAALAEIQTRKAEIVPEIFRQYAEQMTAILKNQDMVYSDQISCLAGNCSFTINWQGEMRPCVTLEEPSVPVFETGFLSAWQKISSESKTFHYHKNVPPVHIARYVRSAWQVRIWKLEVMMEFRNIFAGMRKNMPDFCRKNWNNFK